MYYVYVLYYYVYVLYYVYVYVYYVYVLHTMCICITVYCICITLYVLHTVCMYYIALCTTYPRGTGVGRYGVGGGTVSVDMWSGRCTLISRGTTPRSEDHVGQGLRRLSAFIAA